MRIGLNYFRRDWPRTKKKYNITLLGGDTVAAPHGLFITINMLSRTNDSIIKRSGACYGDNIYVTGTIGNSAIGLHLLKNKNDNLGLGQLDIQEVDQEISFARSKTQDNQLNKKVCKLVYGYNGWFD